MTPPQLTGDAPIPGMEGRQATVSSHRQDSVPKHTSYVCVRTSASAVYTMCTYIHSKKIFACVVRTCMHVQNSKATELLDKQKNYVVPCVYIRMYNAYSILYVYREMERSSKGG